MANFQEDKNWNAVRQSQSAAIRRHIIGGTIHHWDTGSQNRYNTTTRLPAYN
jgi:hypothetical protein